MYLLMSVKSRIFLIKIRNAGSLKNVKKQSSTCIYCQRKIQYHKKDARWFFSQHMQTGGVFVCLVGFFLSFFFLVNLYLLFRIKTSDSTY